jgi:hypothetical protein
MALQDGTQLQQIGQALGGFGAGIQGNLPQYQATQQTIAASKQEMEGARTKAMYADALGALNFANVDDWDGAIQLGMNRLQALQQLNANPADTQRIMKVLLAAKNGNEEAKDLAKKELESIVEAGYVSGGLDRPEQQNLSEMNQWISEGEGRDVEGFNEYKASIAEDAGYTNVTRLEDGRWFGMRNGIMQEIPADEIVPKLLSADDPGSATQVETSAARRLLDDDDFIKGKGMFGKMNDKDRELAADVLSNEAITLQTRRENEGITLSFNEALSETLQHMKDVGWITRDEDMIAPDTILNIPPGESLFVVSEHPEGTVAQNPDGKWIITENGMWVERDS